MGIIFSNIWPFKASTSKNTVNYHNHKMGFFMGFHVDFMWDFYKTFHGIWDGIGDVGCGPWDVGCVTNIERRKPKSRGEPNHFQNSPKNTVIFDAD